MWLYFLLSIFLTIRSCNNTPPNICDPIDDSCNIWGTGFLDSPHVYNQSGNIVCNEVRNKFCSDYDRP
jgi:hypothetical protein